MLECTQVSLQKTFLFARKTCHCVATWMIANTIRHLQLKVLKSSIISQFFFFFFFFFLCTYLIQQEYKLIQEQNDTTGSNINVIPSGHYIDGAIHTKSEFAKSLYS